MCGRTSLAVDAATLADRFGVSVEAFEPRYNIAPGSELLAIRDDRPDRAAELTWGFVPPWADDPDEGPRPINARSESVAENRLFEDAFGSRRCLILADGFYEWAGPEGRKQPYRIERIDGEPYAYAGLWSPWAGDDAERWTCTILTTEANATVGEVHDRMPVMLEASEESTWLNGAGPGDWRSVFDPYPDDELRAFPVSTRVNDPTNDDPCVAEEVGSQSGLGEFGAD
ncbi:SOS response-associated peptidase [Halolamina litorea]|uniref:SOS response-associated peptidase n=1 Tax=Halolamina litorea TaxID=1515593 RepID=A0ABD6BSG6_9EURY|nr:SOS response-associated peptidase [Halolamina litorea]